MLIPCFAVSIVVISLMVLGAGVVCGQDYPNKPIRLFTSEAGGGSDFAARLLAQELSVNLRQQVIVENRSSNLLGEIVAKTPPDGYTLIHAGSTLWLGQFLRDKMPYDVVTDFLPITLAVTSPSILVVHPSVPVKSVKELIALAKARPGELNYGAGSIGSPPHLAVELFRVMAGVNIVRIPYKGGGPALNGLISGQVQVMITPAASVSPHIKSGRLRALAAASLQPSALAPGLPTVAATIPGYESTAKFGVFAPAKTPEAIINRLNQEIVRVLNRAEVKERFIKGGVEPVGSSPEELATKMKSEMAIMSKVIKDAGIRAD